MITINSGKLTIPESERFIGFAGDNLHSTKQFIVENITDESCIYRLYLEFDDNTVNYFVLDSKVENGSTILTWNILENHIFKSGIVNAQIKSISDSGEAYHTTWDYFYAENSAEFSGEFKDNENSEFLRYEKELNEIYNKINETDLSSFVTQDRTIAGLSLSCDITAEDFYSAIGIYPTVLKEGVPTVLEGTAGGYLIDTINNDLYYCDKRTLSGYNWIKLTGKTESSSNGIKKTHIHENGELIITFSDDTTSNLGIIVGADGKNGTNGKDGVNCADKAKNKKILFLGDSITASSSQNGWVTHFTNIMNPSLCVNVAVSGARFCDYSDTVYDGNPVFEGEDNNVNNVIGNQVEKLIRGKDSTNPNYVQVDEYNDFDIIFIACGTNDAKPTAQIETAFYNDTDVLPLSDVDRTTWAGAFRYAIESLQNLYPNAKIFVCTPIQSCAKTHTYSETKAKGDYLKRLCSLMSVCCIDTMQCGICGLYEKKSVNGRDLRDGLHTNENGALKIAKYNASRVCCYFEPEILPDTALVNVVPLSTDTDGSIYNGTGYKNNTRLGSSGTSKDEEGFVTTGFIPVSANTLLKSEGTATITNDSRCYCCAYDENKELLWYWNAYNGIYNTNSTDIVDMSTGNLNWRLSATQTWTDFDLVKYLRFSMFGTGEGLTITVG